MTAPDPNARPRGPSATDDVPNPIEENDPEGSIVPHDPDGTLVDPLDADTGPRAPISESDDEHSPDS